MKEVFIKNIDDPKIITETDLHLSGKDLIVSDGYHTFDELYDHRITIFIELCRAYHKIELVKGEKIVMLPRPIWRSKLHHDGSEFTGWFVLGINKKEGEQITYHLPLSRWEETDFAETLENAPVFDGHSSSDVLARLKNL